MKISAVYKVTNTITNDFYIGSSKDVKKRWREHKCPSTWKKYPNNPMYQDMQKFGVDNFTFEILAEVGIEELKKIEQQFIEALKPIYNKINANGWDVERYKETKKEYNKEYHKEYKKSNKYKEYNKEYRNVHKEYQKEYQKKYYNQLCCFNGETLTLCALAQRFRKAGIEHPTAEAKKYLLKQ